MRGALSGGILAGLARSLLTRESFFTTCVHNNSPHQTGDVLIAPSDPGGVTLHRLVRGEEMILTGGAYLAADDAVNVASSMQSPFSMFGNYSGTGVFLLRATGQGILAISSYGSMHKYILSPGDTRSVDNGHVVAWTASMKSSIKIASAGILGSMTSGEGLHCEFVGPGVIYIQSHKPSIGPGGGAGTRNGGGHSSGNPIAACIVLLVFVLVVLGFILAVYIDNSTSDSNKYRGYNGWNDL